MGGVLFFMAKRKKRGNDDKAKFLSELGVKYAADLTARATPPELEFKATLERANIRFAFQFAIVVEKNYLYILDFYLPEYKLAFELDGWQHETKEGKRDDRIRTRRLAKVGIAVKRIRNFDVRLFTPQFLKDYLITKKICA